MLTSRRTREEERLECTIAMTRERTGKITKVEEEGERERSE
jgi:hypothetical protein